MCGVQLWGPSCLPQVLLEVFRGGQALDPARVFPVENVLDDEFSNGCLSLPLLLVGVDESDQLASGVGQV